MKNGRMTEGYALVAWPAKYDDTGVMTFIVNHRRHRLPERTSVRIRPPAAQR